MGPLLPSFWFIPDGSSLVSSPPALSSERVLSKVRRRIVYQVVRQDQDKDRADALGSHSRQRVPVETDKTSLENRTQFQAAGQPKFVS
jgi:hypothetical protein